MHGDTPVVQDKEHSTAKRKFSVMYQELRLLYRRAFVLSSWATSQIQLTQFLGLLGTFLVIQL